jgi:pantothenate kinase-related protein Tda10
LQQKLGDEFFGQHLALQTVLNALEAHLKDERSNKALVLSFHGWAGSGKSFLAEHITKALYEKGMDSKFKRFYMASYHFPDPDKVMEYQVLYNDLFGIHRRFI